MRLLNVCVLMGALALWGCDDGDDGGGAAGAGGEVGGAGGEAGGAGGEAGGAGGEAGAGGEPAGGAGGAPVGGEAGAGGEPGGCTDSNMCDEGQICHMGRCVGCRDDNDCIVGYVCEADECVEGCRNDEGCEPGTICDDGACIPGCYEDEMCPDNLICEETCVEGCREDDACPEGQYCDVEGATCAEGCRDDGSCAEGQLCLAHECLFRGVACREDGDCAGSDQCNLETLRCEARDVPCEPDGFEGELGEALTPAEAGVYQNLSICPGDEDLFLLDLAADDQVQIEVAYNTAEATLVVELFADDNAQGDPAATADAEGALSWVSPSAGQRLLRIRGADAETRTSYALTVGIEALPMCMEVTLYADEDNDGYGVLEAPEDLCLEPGAPAPEGFAADTGDCGPQDPLRYPGAAGVCGDNVDDDCVGGDEACPESAPAEVQVPAWRCEDDNPPAEVAAWARFDDGGGYFVDGGCFVFFEGDPGNYYVARHVDRASQDPSCETRNGCTCPSLNGWPSYDRRMYAFTLRGDVESCENVEIIDHGGEDQPVSNHCRKYLYQMHFYDIPFSFVAAGYDTLRQRLDLFPTVEIACVRDAPHRNLPYQSLVNSPIRFNDGHQPQD